MKWYTAVRELAHSWRWRDRLWIEVAMPCWPSLATWRLTATFLFLAISAGAAWCSVDVEKCTTLVDEPAMVALGFSHIAYVTNETRFQTWKLGTRPKTTRLFSNYSRFPQQRIILNRHYRRIPNCRYMCINAWSWLIYLPSEKPEIWFPWLSAPSWEYTSAYINNPLLNVSSYTCTCSYIYALYMYM